MERRQLWCHEEAYLLPIAKIATNVMTLLVKGNTRDDKGALHP